MEKKNISTTPLRGSGIIISYDKSTPISSIANIRRAATSNPTGEVIPKNNNTIASIIK